ncbi:MAG: rhomboid family intramembrane serine protease [Akkermansiaceae bacterium]
MATQPEIPDTPVWARDDAFPEAPHGWGWQNTKGKSHTCESRETLATAIRNDRDGAVTLVWTPENPRMVLPEELDDMGDALRAARDRWTQEDLDDANYKLRWFGGICAAFCLYALSRGFVFAGQLAAQSGTAVAFGQKLKFAVSVVLDSTGAGIALLMFVIFAFIPWYQARKRRKELARWDDAGIAAAVSTLRMETWLGQQQAPLTKALLGLMLFVALAQVLGPANGSSWGKLWAIFHNWEGISAAGLVKERYAQGEWWRLFTAPLLHGNVVHFLMNAAGLAYLGKRLEVFARWPHLPMVFLFAACIGGEASARFTAAPSVGASGGLMGWLGFLLVFETLHRELIPQSARRRLIAGVFLTALIGLIGYRYIDNSAHAGGLLAGMAYAAIVFPKSASACRPRSTVTDRIAGMAALGILLVAGAFAIHRLVGG